jgi:ABC-type dipeptide/oligopeptide/nickel transport system permease subunit
MARRGELSGRGNAAVSRGESLRVSDVMAMHGGTWSPGKRASVWRSLSVRRHPFLIVGLTICVLIAVIAIASPLLAPFNPIQPDVPSALEAPSMHHLFGTDALGRDLFSRVLYGARVSYLSAVLATLVGCALGSVVGLAAGFVGGAIDNVLMRVIDALSAFPALVLAIAIVATLGAGTAQTIAAIAIVAIPRYARVMRAQTLSQRNRDFVLAARIVGAHPLRIAGRHILPNTLGIIIVLASASAGFAVLTEASLSFLGLGTQPPTPEWGSMLKDGVQFLQQASWLAIFPGIAISVLVLGFNLLGDGVRDLLDPRTR